MVKPIDAALWASLPPTVRAGMIGNWLSVMPDPIDRQKLLAFVARLEAEAKA